MANDTREDHGSYYPGAKVIVSGSGTSGTATDVSGKVDRVTIGEIGDAYTLKTVKEKVDKLIKAVAPVASCLAAMLYVSTAMAATEVFEDIPSNARVVVSEDDPVALAAIPEVVGAATNAAVEAAKAYADAAVAIEASNRADAVEGGLVRAKSDADTATNARAAKIPVVGLEPYATKAWVQSQGYLDSGSVDGVATKEWVSQQDFLTTLALTPYATIEWVIGRGYATPSVTNGLASMKWVEAKDYAAKSWVDGKGYATPSVTNGLAGESWVMSRGFVTKSVTNGLATRTWVEQKGYLPSESAKRTYATKDELDALKRMYADTNGVTRLWSYDGFTMTDGTGVVWDVTWNVVTNWTSLSNGVVFAQVKDQMGFGKWVSQGIYTNALGQSSSAQIHFEGGVFSIFLDAHAGSTGTFEVSPGQVLVDAHDYGYNDTFRNSTVRVPAFAVRSMVVTNAVGYVVSGTITDGTNTITAAGDAIAAGIGKGYWMVRRIPDGAWRKLVPVPESDNALWRDVDTNSYVGDYSGAPDGMWTGSVDGFSNTFYIPAERYEAFSNSNAEGYYVPDRKTIATVDQIPTTATQVGAATPEDVSAAADSAVATANAYTDGQTTPLWSYLGADNFRVVVTNYDSAVHPPVASFEYRMTTNEAFRTVWNETNGLNRAIATATNLAHQAAKQLVNNPANRAWGKYDSETGEASPEGVIQATAPGGLIVGGGLRWSQISAESGWWLITSTDPTLCRTGTNGVFSIIGSDGQEAIRIVKGNKVTVPAPADSISVESGVCTVTYAVEAEQHPTAHFASKLGGEAGTVWYNEGDADCPVTMTWSGTSGNYVLTFDTAGLSPGFVQATYEQGQESYTSFGGAGLELTKIRIGGKVYTVGTATIDGKTVLTLE